jgi:predicted nucleic acid-binding protein
MNITIDASVWVAARFDNEPSHVESTEFLLRAMGTRQTIVLPWLAIVECVAAVARKTGNARLADEVGAHLLGLPDVLWVALDETVVGEAIEVAAERRLRAADAVYAAVARSHGATLVTLDAEMLSHRSPRLRCVSPRDWIAGHGS